MSWSLTRAATLCCAAFVGACAGPRETKMERIDPEVWNSPHATPVRPTNSVSVTEGRLPLAYQAVTRGVVRLIDQTTGAPLMGAAVKPGDMLAVTSEQGAVLTRKHLTGPLLADHRYAIYFEIQNAQGTAGQVTVPER